MTKAKKQGDEIKRHIPIISNIVDKYEVPLEYHAALWDAYLEGSKQGFIDGGISIINNQFKSEANHES